MVEGRVLASVERALEGVPADWRTEIARGLATALDAEPKAALARELRATMAAIASDGPAETKGTPLDELTRRRADREPDADDGPGPVGGEVGS